MKILKIDHLYGSDLHRDVPCNNPLIPPVKKCHVEIYSIYGKIEFKKKKTIHERKTSQKSEHCINIVPSLRIAPLVPLVVSWHVGAVIRACMVSYLPLSPFYVHGPFDNIPPTWLGLHVVSRSVGIV